MKELKVAIALAYYKRPKIVLNALQSIKELNYDNWHLFFIDDSGDISFRTTLMEFGLPKDKVTYIPILDSDDQKKIQGGSRHGEFINNVYYMDEFDIGITLCDDDAIHPGYFNHLNTKYQEDANCHWTYSRVLFYNPEKESYKQARQYPDNPGLNTWTLNFHNGDIAPSCKVDGAQVSFRLPTFRILNIKYPSPQTRDCDRAVFEQLANRIGPSCKLVEEVGQIKGWFPNQLGYRHKVNNSDYADSSWANEYLDWIDSQDSNKKTT